MAILPSSPGLEAEILIDGDALTEYRDDECPRPPHNTTSKYIEAKSGATFEIRYAFLPPFPSDRAISLKVHLDGRLMDEPLIRTDELFEVKGHLCTGSLSTNGVDRSVQKFCFSELDVVEGDGSEIVSEALRETLNEIGTITLEFCFVENLRRNEYVRVPRKVVDDIGTIPEKAVKGEALSHQMSLRPAEKTEEYEYFDAEYADDARPFATFHFKYRNISALKALLIIPRDPEPINLNTINISLLSAAQVKRLYKSVEAEKKEWRKIKREREDSTTVCGDEDDDLIFVEKRRKICLPTPDDTVFVLD